MCHRAIIQQTQDLTVISGDSPGVRHAWTRYTECETSRNFRPCYTLLSAEMRRWWDDHGGPTPEGYYDVKGSEPVGYHDFSLVAVREAVVQRRYSRMPLEQERRASAGLGSSTYSSRL